MLKKVSDTIYYVGVNDHGLDLFEGQFSVPNGMAYNSYVILDEKTAVMDTVDGSRTRPWLANVAEVLDGRKPDYLVVHHMEPDHAASIEAFVNAYPEVCVVGNAKTFQMIGQFFPDLALERTLTVRDADSLSLGSHVLTFAFAPMVHWPEVMMTYDPAHRVLFSADAFGKFGALDADEPWDCEARRYYFAIVAKYGRQVQDILKRLAALEIRTICPLHGPVLTGDLRHYIHLYDLWSGYTPESQGVVIAYTSAYGHTGAAAGLLEQELVSRGVPAVTVHDLARTDMAEAVEDAFRYDTLVLAAPTYNGDVFPFMRTYLDKLTERAFQNRTVAFIQNGSWAPAANRVMKEKLSRSKNLTFAENEVTILSALNDESRRQIRDLAEELAAPYGPVKLDPAALNTIGYGLYVVTSREGEKDNGLIVNTVTQVTSTPNRVAVTINKGNFSCEVIARTGLLNVSVLSQEAPFSLFEQFGFHSGRDTDKFAGFAGAQRAANGLLYLDQYANGVICCRVAEQVDLGTHVMFLCDVTGSSRLSDAETMTYAYYHKHVKPRPESRKKGYVCKICGWIYEGEDLPEDIVCPLCKHGAADFEPLK